MLRRKSPSINTFRLINNSFDCSKFDIETWVTTAVDHNVQNLDLDFQPDTIFTLPKCLYTCKTLVYLSLGFCAFPLFSGAVSLPSLVKLHLYSIEYAVNETLPLLLSGCPLLKELIIERILNHDLGCLDISSPTLKWLKVNFPFDGSEFGYPGYRVKINAPALRYLEVNDCSYELISISPNNSLVEANIWLNNYTLEVDYSVYTCCVLKFLDSLCNVKCLYLFGWFEKVCMYNLDLALAGSIVKFRNLTKLELAADWHFLPKFLESADHLEIIHSFRKQIRQKGFVKRGKESI
ncbi:F-box/FBD/LRR-repeat protein at5g56420 [Phtheirospermum japonicum]|uniref:F-box/FBD/LRR-repeat protein at5g56420 n=1 Tax=Phtheirospermum japonicum TaxID=374723 RepID=A0A830C938_9LAMI|nr:F-box/FBD/LRR-repeat protein at5g56420 [Phtheirospermum japonicum]